MDRLLSLAIATTGGLVGLLIATGRVADGVTPLMLVLLAAVALRMMRLRKPM